MKISKCRVCGSKKFHQILDLGMTPLANSFLKMEEINFEEPYFPLNVVWCETCGLMQIDEIVPPEKLFKNYIYVSGTSTTLKTHFKDLAKSSVDITNAKPEDLVIDIASNDGTLLKQFKNLGVKILGIEPAENIVKKAIKAGIPTECDFINEKIAKKVANDYGKAKIITATNVVAHINDLSQLMNSIKILLRDDGIFVMEVPYLVDLIENNEFDTIYHEHLSYISVHPMKKLFEKNGMDLFKVQHVKIHGGSIRLFASKNSKYPINKSVNEFLEKEKEEGILNYDYYHEFALNIQKLKSNLIEKIREIKDQGKKIFGYGASAKGNTLLNYFNINKNMLDCIIDLNPMKQNLVSPGTHIPVLDANVIEIEKPDYLLLLAWNFKDEIIEQQKIIRNWGGKFIIPIPKVEIL